MTGSAAVFVQHPQLAVLARRQHGVVTRAQLREHGISWFHVTQHVESARWRTLSDQVVVVHRGPLVPEAQRWAAVLGAPAGSVLGARTALEILGLRGWQVPAVHLVVARGARPPSHPWQCVHESRRLDDEHVVDVGGLPVHCVERAAVDTAAWQPSARTATGVLAAVVQQGLTTPARLASMLDVVGAVRHRTAMRWALADIAGGADSLAEIDFGRLCRKAGIPEPSRQRVRTDARGRRRYLDVEWTLSGGGRLVVEIDGVGHLDRERWYDDLMRDAEIGTDTRTIRVRLPAAAARLEPERVLAVVRRHLATLGWQSVAPAA